MSWPKVSFLSVCDIQGGTQPPRTEFSSELSEGYIRLLQIRDFKNDNYACYVPDKRTLKKCDKKDILIGRYGASIGRILTGKAGAYNVAIVKTIPDTKKLDRRYLYFFLCSEHFQNFILNTGGRAAQAGFNKKELERLKIPLPPFDEQRRIAAILDKADEVERETAKIQEMRDEIIQATFLDMFGTNIVSKNFSEGFVQLSEIIRRKQSSLDPRKYPSEEFEMYSIPAYDLGRADILMGSEIGSSKKILHPGDVVISRLIPHIRRVWVIPMNNGRRQIGSSEWIVFNTEKYNPLFLRYLFLSDEFNIFFLLAVAGVGGSLIRARPAVVSKYYVKNPPIELQNQFADIVRQITAMDLSALETQATTLKQSLAQELLA